LNGAGTKRRSAARSSERANVTDLGSATTPNADTHVLIAASTTASQGESFANTTNPFASTGVSKPPVAIRRPSESSPAPPRRAPAPPPPSPRTPRTAPPPASSRSPPPPQSLAAARSPAPVAGSSP